ncbi:MAG: hypothetical protein ABWX84_02820 [Nocardioides sp.]
MHTSTNTRAGLVTCVGVAALLIAAMSNPAVAGEPDTTCVHRSVDPRYLPHTADAIEGWLSGCSGSLGTPGTADAAEAWLG